jgi:hypothetical protein
VAYQQHAAFAINHRALRAERHPAPHPPDRPEHGGQQAVRPETPDEIPVQSALLACGLIYFFFVRCLPRFAPYCLQDRSQSVPRRRSAGRTRGQTIAIAPTIDKGFRN